MSAINKLLPKGYSLHMDRTHAKRNFKKNLGLKKRLETAKTNSSGT